MLTFTIQHLYKFKKLITTFDFDKTLRVRVKTNKPLPHIGTETFIGTYRNLTCDLLSVISISMYSQELVISRTDPLLV